MGLSPPFLGKRESKKNEVKAKINQQFKLWYFTQLSNLGKFLSLSHCFFHPHIVVCASIRMHSTTHRHPSMQRCCLYLQNELLSFVAWILFRCVLLKSILKGQFQLFTIEFEPSFDNYCIIILAEWCFRFRAFPSLSVGGELALVISFFLPSRWPISITHSQGVSRPGPIFKLEDAPHSTRGFARTHALHQRPLSTVRSG